MPLRALRKSAERFTAFDSVAACRACATGASAAGATARGRESAEVKAAETGGSENGFLAMAHPMPANNEREAQLCALAHKLLFKVERSGERFTLTRTADVSKPVRHERLTIDQVEELLGNWKLRGLGGG